MGMIGEKEKVVTIPAEDPFKMIPALPVERPAPEKAPLPAPAPQKEREKVPA